jgi:hypothetical protein
MQRAGKAVITLTGSQMKLTMMVGLTTELHPTTLPPGTLDTKAETYGKLR